MRISYAISVCDEDEELYRILNHMFELIESDDEIIVLRDLSKTNSGVSHVLEEFKPIYKTKLIIVDSRLDGDFAAFKNKFIEHATGDYLFQIDADEVPHEFLIENIKPILQVNKDIDCLYVPRVNKVTGLTPEHIQKWGWKVDDQGRVNYPDPQMRIFKLNKGIKWKNKVHEVLDGHESVTVLPYDEYEDFCLYHIKTIEKQEQQNNFYEQI